MTREELPLGEQKTRVAEMQVVFTSEDYAQKFDQTILHQGWVSTPDHSYNRQMGQMVCTMTVQFHNIEDAIKQVKKLGDWVENWKKRFTFGTPLIVAVGRAYTNHFSEVLRP